VAAVYADHMCLCLCSVCVSHCPLSPEWRHSHLKHVIHMKHSEEEKRIVPSYLSEISGATASLAHCSSHQNLLFFSSPFSLLLPRKRSIVPFMKTKSFRTNLHYAKKNQNVLVYCPSGPAPLIFWASCSLPTVRTFSANITKFLPTYFTSIPLSSSL
jgi:hypothetical protein